MALERSCLAVVLAAGEGTRMRSARPKVLHAIAGRSLLAHVLHAVREAGGTLTAVVGGLGAEAVAAEAKRILPDAEIFVQAERRGTAHAVLAAKAAIARAPDDVLVIFGDTPLIRPQTLTRIREAVAQGAAVVVLGFRPKDPAGYGRLVVEDGKLHICRDVYDQNTNTEENLRDSPASTKQHRNGKLLKSQSSIRFEQTPHKSNGEYPGND